MNIPPLKSIYFYTSGDCNLKCRHCWIEPTFQEHAEKVTPWNKLKPIFEDAMPLGLRHVKLTGGEPCLHPEITKIINDLHEMGLSISMETNATLLTPSLVKAMKAAKMFVAVSLDGPDKESHEWLRGVKGSWEQALAGLKMLKENKIGFQVICSLHRGNIDKFQFMPALVHSLGGTSLKVNPITGTGRSEIMKSNNELIEMIELLKFYDNDLQKIRQDTDIRIYFDIPPAFKKLSDISKQKLGVCGIFTILGVLHDGSTGLCGIGEKVSELNFGSPLDENNSLKQIWEDNPVLNRIRENVPHNLKGICAKCKMKHYCLGKCMAHTYVASGDLLSGFPFCEEAYREGIFPLTRLVTNK